MASRHQTTLRLRPHHICCSRFWHIPVEDRGADFGEMEHQIKQALLSDNVPIEVVEGMDGLCALCPNLSGAECISPNGDEAEVRKWDALLLRDLGVQTGTVMESGQWRLLVDSRVPFAVCRRCQWRGHCAHGEAPSSDHPAARHQGWLNQRQLAAGVQASLVWGERMTLSMVKLDPGATLPLHSHPHEQIGVVVEGKVRMVIGEQELFLEKGTAYVVPPGTPHGATTGSDPALVLDAFSPPREDYK